MDVSVADIGIVTRIESGADLVELPPSVDVDEVTEGTATNESVPVDGSVAAPPAARTRSGVRTRKKRATAASLPPLTLAVDPRYCPTGR